MRSLGPEDPLEVSVGYQDLPGLLTLSQPSFLPAGLELVVEEEQDQKEQKIRHETALTTAVGGLYYIYEAGTWTFIDLINLSL